MAACAPPPRRTHPHLGARTPTSAHVLCLEVAPNVAAPTVLWGQADPGQAGAEVGRGALAPSRPRASRPRALAPSRPRPSRLAPRAPHPPCPAPLAPHLSSGHPARPPQGHVLRPHVKTHAQARVSQMQCGYRPFFYTSQPRGPTAVSPHSSQAARLYLYTLCDILYTMCCAKPTARGRARGAA